MSTLFVILINMSMPWLKLDKIKWLNSNLQVHICSLHRKRCFFVRIQYSRTISMSDEVAATRLQYKEIKCQYIKCKHASKFSPWIKSVFSTLLIYKLFKNKYMYDWVCFLNYLDSVYHQLIMNILIVPTKICDTSTISWIKTDSSNTVIRYHILYTIYRSVNVIGVIVWNVQFHSVTLLCWMDNAGIGWC